MNHPVSAEISASVAHFSLPRLEEIPNVGLYLEQTSKYISEYLAPLGDFTLTGSMISNYVKKGLIANPVKKQYNREQIAYLFFIAVAKTVLSMEDIRRLIHLQQETYAPEKAYEYLRRELDNVLHYVFGSTDSLQTVGQDDTHAKHLLRNVIIAVAYKVYLDKSLAALPAE